MKKFTRPILFAVARLGLFCAMITWIAAQFSGASLHVPLGRRMNLAELHPRGYVLVCWDPAPTGAGAIPPLTLETYSEPINGPMYSDMFADGPRKDSVTFTLDVPGVTAGRFMDMASFVTLRHWFVVAGFIVLYGVLKWTYREQAESSEPSLSARKNQ